MTTHTSSTDRLLSEVLAAAALPARQQPQWCDRGRLAEVRTRLSISEPIVDHESVRRLSGLLVRAAHGELGVLQAGDCAEDPAECGVDDIRPKVELLDMLGDVMGVGAGTPVLKVGRIAGQYAKPRSADHEVRDGVRLPVYRGSIVNSPVPTPSARRADPERVLLGHVAARRTVAAVDELGRGRGAAPEHRVWTSHEALLLDYEVPQIRTTPDGGLYLASTHWPWIGERTRQLDGAHVRLLSLVDNPVACKIGPSTSVDEVLGLCAALDPDRTPGRLTLIPRFGAAHIDDLGPLVRAVVRAGHPVLWLCDPMHGNTVVGDHGLKTRRLGDVMAEIDRFVRVVTANGGLPAGLHLEASAANVSECEGAGVVVARGEHYRTLCDPRLNTTQAVAAVAHWHRTPMRVAA
ncbi:3-deoxy-7-phosphoheptulonate synthase [Saccharothrix yanglingensis]|uniref:Phospho-2-dehydro-3-deoxyheptonate aldolase n=1 Tax=Saccharothrix yanglingensis TaxID=659496 RepID=A0ABU0WUI0_9PSEU|nr:3-deoxy-7-phosphoheptulonate synthase [Saccharothrix yanglingensis]MDQ2583513.1 phospho-2-dehydro-3-deoxyheptonate aldolase [Saccharothrix yanglingensis]